MNGSLEMRVVVDCETMEEALQFRYLYGDMVASGWTTVPRVMGVIRRGEVETVYGNQK
jgi:hypothetical protein